MVWQEGISLGYFILAALTFSNLFIKFKVLSIKVNVTYLAIYAALTLIFYGMTKKYFYRWIEWVFIEYQYTINESVK